MLTIEMSLHIFSSKLQYFYKTEKEHPQISGIKISVMRSATQSVNNIKSYVDLEEIF